MTTRATAKSNQKEDFNDALVITRNAIISDPIDLILRKDCTTGALRKVIKHLRE